MRKETTMKMLTLALAGAAIISRSIARPIERIVQVTEAVAAGNLESEVPYGARRDEIGALARSVAVSNWWFPWKA